MKNDFSCTTLESFKAINRKRSERMPCIFHDLSSTQLHLCSKTNHVCVCVFIHVCSFMSPTVSIPLHPCMIFRSVSPGLTGMTAHFYTQWKIEYDCDTSSVVTDTTEEDRKRQRKEGEREIGEGVCGRKERLTQERARESQREREGDQATK